MHPEHSAAEFGAEFGAEPGLASVQTAPDVCVSPAPYLPFADPRSARAPGLWALEPATWVQRDAAFAAQMQLRDAAVEQTPDKVALVADGGAPLVAEMIDGLRDHLLAHDAGYRSSPDGALVRPDGVGLPPDTQITTLARMTQEDWLLLAEPAPRAEAVLVAGALCFPSHWTLAAKIGKPLGAVHEPVPGYASDLAPRVNRVFAALHPDRPLQRTNWTLADVPTLPCHGDYPARQKAAPAFLRVERQTLRRLPRTGGIVFGVKTYMTPLAGLSPADLDALIAAVGRMTVKTRDYKGGDGFFRSVGLVGGAASDASGGDI